MQKIIRARSVRLLLGTTLIAAGLWAFLPYLTQNVASSAYVNAELIRVTAPIAGRLTSDLPLKGRYIEKDVSLPLVDTLAPDRRQLSIFETEYSVISASIELAETQAGELEIADQALADRLAIHRTAVLEKLSHQVDEAAAQLTACKSKEVEDRELLAISKHLSNTGYGTKRNLTTARAAHGTTAAECKAAASRLKRLKSERKAAEQGVYLEDGHNDTPYSQQQRDRLLIRRQNLQAQLTQERARFAQLDTQIASERERLEQLSRFELVLPAGHVVWSVTASPGSAVVEGQTLIDLVDCSRRFITVEIPERKIESFRTGDPASVRLLGSDTWMDGTIRQVRGSAARQGERLLASQILKPEVRHVTVEVVLSPGALSQETSRFCDIGRLADVRFERNSFRSSSKKVNPLLGRNSRLTIGTASDAGSDVDRSTRSQRHGGSLGIFRTN